MDKMTIFYRIAMSIAVISFWIFVIPVTIIRGIREGIAVAWEACEVE